MDTQYKKVAVAAALKSGALIKRSVGKIKNISYKGRINLVTDVDKASEKLIIRTILKAFPDHSILSEESRPTQGASGYKWVIDPIDGTTNFARQFPFFCNSIGLEKDGQLVLGVVYDPMRDELFCAEKGKGAYLNGKRIHVTAITTMSDAFLTTGFAYGLNRIKDNVDNFKRFLMRALAVRRPGSAALDFCYVACGRFDGFWELYLHPWDCAAGVLMVTEAGGKVTKFDGSEYSHYDREVLASNGAIHKKMVKVLLTE
ncbi:MAG: inositol monophosphatase family protein [Candidatus Omnitrophota bacterium]